MKNIVLDCYFPVTYQTISQANAENDFPIHKNTIDFE
jgi:hypothetical protein